MPIRPIDMLSMPNRSQEVSQVHHTQNQKLTHAQEQLGVQYQSNVKHDGKQTVKMNKSENQEYRYGDGKKQNSEYSGQNRQKRKKNDDKKPEFKQGNFDIRI